MIAFEFSPRRFASQSEAAGAKLAKELIIYGMAYDGKKIFGFLLLKRLESYCMLYVEG